MKRRKLLLNKSQRLTITLGIDQRRQIALIARRRRTSAAAIIRWAVDDYIDAHATKSERRENLKPSRRFRR